MQNKHKTIVVGLSIVAVLALVAAVAGWRVAAGFRRAGAQFAADNEYCHQQIDKCEAQLKNCAGGRL